MRCVGFPSRLLLIVLLIGCLVAVSGGTALMSDREAGAQPEEWEDEALDAFARDMAPAAEVVAGFLYEFDVWDDHIEVTFPDHLGGETQILTLGGELALFIEDPGRDSTIARLWIYSHREEIHDVRAPLADLDGDGILDMVDLGTIIVDAGLLHDPEAGSLPAGFIDLATGEFEWNSACRLSENFALQELAEEYGFDDWGTVNATEGGILYAEDGYMEIFGAATISAGFLEGTRISFSPKGGSQKSKTRSVYVWLNPSSNDCGAYSGYVSFSKTITGKGVSTWYTGTKYTFISHSGKGNYWWGAGTGSSTKWNGLSTGGWWYLLLGSPGQYCYKFPSQACFLVTYQD